eukprot:CAMPEP_0176065934 /NCGR_PEP_ID=MMETSP0120_2-20121206/32901_1 /TAXON_ID=160619 /ORGANISM="Kryptoperidinium foliaceum, Strain CCMP 1326" /LENGTH=633 /DNA_ID=CAMNT_0017399535 /DNA_START=104 /DNA_END=2008 /DNA_ORIENTATION=+
MAYRPFIPSLSKSMEADDAKLTVIRMEVEPSRVAPLRKPCILTSHQVTPYQLRLIFRKIEDHEGGAPMVPVVLFRRCFRRWLDMHDPRISFDLEAFGSCTEGFKMNWTDVRALIDREAMPKIPLCIPQVVFLAMEDFTTSHIATAWYVLTNVVIVINIVVIILQSLSGYSDESVKIFGLINDWCVQLFIFEYFVKAFCVQWCPIAYFDAAWALDHVLPFGESEHLLADSLHTTKLQRFSHWALTTNNVVDLVSMSPKLLSVVLSGMHLPLSSLRMLRLLRVIRVLRAFRVVGKWVTTLQVLSEALFSALGSVFVLVLYIALFSMVAGAVLYNEEDHSKSDHYDTVPSAIAYVTERFVGDSFSKAQTLLGGLILASVGVFKATIFLLPIERLKTATTAAEAKFQENARFREQVERETNRASTPKHLLWVNDFRCPTVRIQVWDARDDANGDPAFGTLHIPILSKEWAEAVVAVPLHGGRVKKLFGKRPELEMKVTWESDEDYEGTLPKGLLKLQVLRGSNFAGGPDTRWRVFLEVPETLYGARASADWTSPTSLTGTSTPEWGEDALRESTIEWGTRDEQKGPENVEDKFRRRVLKLLDAEDERRAMQASIIEMLERQSAQLAELESKTRAMQG